MTRNPFSEPVRFMLTKPQLAAIVPFASTDPARVNLNAIAFYEDGRMAATDGHRLAIFMADAGTVHAHPIACLPGDVARDLLKSVRARESVEIVISPGRGDPATFAITVREKPGRDLPPEAGAVRFTRTAADVDAWVFPPVWQVLPASGWASSDVGVCINGCYVAESCAALGRVLESDAATVEIVTGQTALDPVQVRAGSWVHVIMPMRGEPRGIVTQGREHSQLAA